MGKVDGFVVWKRQGAGRRPAGERTKDWREFYEERPVESKAQQGGRCMDCGVPFCHQGCPLGNLIPDFNDLVFRGEWDEAFRVLSSTNNFPEFTGRLCPAPCEAACVLGINDTAVTIEQIEKEIVEAADGESRGASTERIKRCKEKLLPQRTNHKKKCNHERAQGDHVREADAEHIAEQEVEEITNIVWD
jgi:hypothetical protein